MMADDSDVWPVTRGEQLMNGSFKLNEGVSLEWGIPGENIRKEVERVRPHSIRPSDLDELVDTLITMNYSLAEVRDNFGSLLAKCLGLEPNTTSRYYMIRHNSMPLFVATLSRVGDEGVCLMCGFGVQKGYELLSKRDIFRAIYSLFSQLRADMKYHFNAQYAVCHVKETNMPTLSMWRKLSRVNNGMYAISIADDPFTRKPYKLVTLALLGGQ